MKNLYRYLFPFLIPLAILLSSCHSNHEKHESAEHAGSHSKSESKFRLEEEIKATVDSILTAAGNYDIETLASMSFEKANLGVSSYRDGAWHSSVRTMEEYFESIRQRTLIPYCEIPYEYTIHISEGQLAVAIADNILYRYGIPQTKEINYFTLIKENGSWKIVNVAFTIVPVPLEERHFDTLVFARSYAQSWSSKKPEFVASYFSEDGSLQVNEGLPARGRAEIASIAESFMTIFPDINVSFDKLVTKPEGIEFHWTLSGTDSDPAGKGHKVKISGFELWTMSEDGRIKKSEGKFSAEEYMRQLEFGIDNK